MQRPLTAHIDPSKPPLNLKAYEQAGGYRAIRKALRSMAPQEVTAMMRASNLQGRGRFPDGAKMELRAHGRRFPAAQIPGDQRR